MVRRHTPPCLLYPLAAFALVGFVVTENPHDSSGLHTAAPDIVVVGWDASLDPEVDAELDPYADVNGDVDLEAKSEADGHPIFPVEHEAGRERRVYRTTTTQKWSTIAPWTTSRVTTTTTSTTKKPTTAGPTPPMDDFSIYYVVSRNSAINMQGRSYYVNYNESKEELNVLMRNCYHDPTCVSFDYSHAKQEGWTHRIGKACAKSAGANFINGKNSGTDFYELVPGALANKGANNTYLGGEDGCAISIKETLDGPDSKELAWGRAFAALVATLCASAGLSWGVIYLLGWGTDRYEIWQVLNRNLDPNDHHVFDDDDSSDDDSDGGADDEGVGVVRVDGAVPIQAQAGVEVVVLDRAQDERPDGRG